MEGMKDQVWAKFYNGIRYFETKIPLTNCGEIPEFVQIPIDMQEGLCILYHYELRVNIDDNFPIYSFTYQQGIYDRLLQN